MSRFLRTPHIASTIFSFDGPSAARPKNLFFVRLQRAGTSPDGAWQKDIAFLVKTVTRPRVEAKTEELNQYNKRRQVYTGYTLSPVNMTIYDTADSMALRMWSEYSRHYFGDFRHEQTPSDFRWDVTADQMKDSGGGFGFSPLSDGEDQAQFYFETASIYQVFGNKFVQFDLINPRITSFEPDDLDYENSSFATISLSFAYEALIHRNNGQPLPISQDGFLMDTFGDARGDGDIVQYTEPQTNPIPRVQAATSPLFRSLFPQEAPQNQPLRQTGGTVSSGNLNVFGTFNFGSVAAPRILPRSDTDLVAQTELDGSIARLLTSSPTNPLVAPNVGPGSVDPATFDVARGAVTGLGNRGGRYDTSYIADPVALSLIGSARARGGSPRDGVRDGDPNAGRSFNSAEGQPLSLSPQVFGLLNARRSPTSQLGFNERGRRPRPGDGTET